MLKKIITLSMVVLLSLGAKPIESGETIKRGYSEMCRLCEEYCERNGFYEHHNIRVWVPVRSTKSDEYFFIKIYTDSYDYATIIDTIYFCD